MEIGTLESSLKNISFWNRGSGTPLDIYTGTGIFSGNVGIGTDTPRARLDIAGRLRIADG